MVFRGLKRVSREDDKQKEQRFASVEIGELHFLAEGSTSEEHAQML